MSIFETVFSPFTWLLNNTIFYLFKWISWIIVQILPSSYTSIFDEFMLLLWNGIIKTFYLAFFGTIFGLIFACFLGVIRTIKVNKKDPLLIKCIKRCSNWIIKVYVTLFRGTPMLVQSLIIYYILSDLFAISSFDAALITVTINTCAYLTEVIRSAIESIDKGQSEAARSLGFSYTKTLLLIVFPQALKNAMSSIGNEFIINIKDTSVLNVIGCAEMYLVLKSVAGKGFYLETMIAGALIYLILTYSMTKLLNFIEKKLDVPVVDLPSCN